MKILFAGTTAQAARVLQHLASHADVVAVLTREDAPVGRKREVTPSPVAELATALGINTIKANRVDAEVEALITATGAELGVVIAYGALLKSTTLNLLPHGWLNLHYSLLPKWRGAAPVQHTLLAGETETGVSIFKLDEGMDTGDLYLQVPTVIAPDENTAALLDRLTTLGITGLDELLPSIAANTAITKPQNGYSSLAPKLSRTIAHLDFELPALQLENLIRACNPEPMAWASLNDQPLRIISARAVALQSDLENGSVFVENGKVLVSTGSNVLQLLEVQPAGKRAMAAADWARGLGGAVVLR